jgi:D-alanyl-D-alanine carboxypeptidase/D-alanyl-D-alanine-endopeptidase (penicillin-binding protein 4)
MNIFRALLALALVAQAAAAQNLASRLEHQIPAAIEASAAARSAYWGIELYDLSTGRTLYSRNATHLFIPASNAKLFTAALALDRLGPDYRFQTRVFSAAPPDADGVIHGAVRLVGGGDPNLSARVVPYQPPKPAKPGAAGPNAVEKDPLIYLEDLADQIAAHGVKRIEGPIVGDDTWYVWEPYPEGWSASDLQYDYGAPVSALTINDNTFTLTLQSGAHPGELAQLSLLPALEFYQIDNRVVTVPVRSERKIHVDRQPGSHQIRIWGSLPVDSAFDTELLAIDDPATYAARALRRALENRGIVVMGGAEALHLYPDEMPPETSADPFELASHQSAPLIDDLGITAKVSQNLHAELALRAVARARRGIGSREAGIEEMKAFLRQVGIAGDAYSFRDASGLDRADLVTPAAVISLLRYMYESPNRQSWIDLLPIGGEDGTLSGRFTDGASTGRIHAKTGSLMHIAALSGYAQRPGGSWVAFSILVNNFNAPAASIRGVIDRICTLILK